MRCADPVLRCADPVLRSRGWSTFPKHAGQGSYFSSDHDKPRKTENVSEKAKKRLTEWKKDGIIQLQFLSRYRETVKIDSWIGRRGRSFLRARRVSLHEVWCLVGYGRIFLCGFFSPFRRARRKYVDNDGDGTDFKAAFGGIPPRERRFARCFRSLYYFSRFLRRSRPFERTGLFL